MKKLGFGMMRLPLTDKSKEDSIDLSLLQKMVDSFIERGFTYFDTAWMYCGGKSENAVKEVLATKHPRDTYTVTSKLPNYLLKCLDDRDKVLNEQLNKTGLEYFDYYLLHDINHNSIKNFEKYDCFNWIIEKKNQGLVKHIGFSFHAGPELLDKLLTEHPEMEFVQLQINYLDWESAGVQSRACYEVALKHNKPIIVMEPVKGGTLANVPESVEGMFKSREPDMSAASWAIRFAASLKNVWLVLSGMSDMAQLNDNMDYMSDFKPLTDEEISLCHKAADIINGNIAIPCTGCSYCTVDCPKNIPIPKYFSLYNNEIKENKTKNWTVESAYYNSLCADFGKASDCIKCGKCELMCPQHLPIRKHLEEAAELFGK